MPPRIALCLEQTLGHRTHGLNLEAAASAAGDAHVIRVSPSQARGRLPWAVAASLSARGGLRRTRECFAATLYHTQSLCLAPPAAAGASVISVDATPIQFDRVGLWYEHRMAARPLEAAKQRIYQRRFRAASGLVAWSEWARDSLVSDYGVDADRVFVAHPGAGPAFFAITRKAARPRPNILFVGGDFERKGGPQLLEAWSALESRADLTLVTNAPVTPRPGLTVHNDIAPGDPTIIDIYANADVFCLPTFGDCTPVVFAEAMAAGVPIVATDVGSNPEVVTVDETGLIVPAGDVASLRRALETLIDDVAVRHRMGEAARARAHDVMDARRNADAVLGFIRGAA